MKIKIGFFAILFGLSLLLSHSLFSLAAVLAALCHELGHLLAARILGIGFREFRVGLYGAGLEPSGELFSYGQEILLCLAGPLTNLTLALLLWKMPHPLFVSHFIFSSLALGILNLLPIRGFDGGRTLQALLLFFFPPRTVRGILNLLSFLFVFLLWSFSVFCLLRIAATLSLFIFSLSLFFRLFVNVNSSI